MADEHPIEEWRSVEGWPYEVSNLGRIKNRKGKVLKPQPDVDGYRRYFVSDGGRKRMFLKISVLVCEAFNGSRPSPEHECAHDDGNKTNDTATNLIWKTSVENNEDRRRHGTLPLGEKHPASKLTKKDILTIRRLILGGAPQRDLAVAYGVSQTTISDIKYRKSWAWL